MRKAGNYTRDCVSGAWAGYPLECQAPPAQACPRLSPPQHAQRAVCSGMTQGDVCSFKCVAGFQPEGQAKRLWVDGARLGPPLACRPSACPLLPVPARAAGAACPGLAVGEVCLFACQQSFEPAPGSFSVQVCGPKGWGGFPLSCVVPATRSCAPLSTPSNAFRVDCDSQDDGSSAPSGAHQASCARWGMTGASVWRALGPARR